MNHRHGHRWQIDLKILITFGGETQPYPACLTNLSFDGAAIRFSGLSLKQGGIVEVQLPGETAPVQALTVHVGDEIAGLLWVERSPWVERMVGGLMSAQEVFSGYSNAVALG